MRKLILLGCGIALVLTVSMLSVAVFVVGPIMVVPFLATIEIVNDSGLPVCVTPIGMWEASGRYGPLPRYDTTLSVPRRLSATHALPIAPGATLRITYDTDDINFRHILVSANGQLRILDTDKRGSLHACYGPQQRQYVIPAFHRLPLSSGELAPCTQGKRVRYSHAVEYR